MKISKSVNIIVVFIWFVLIALLLYKNYTGVSLGKLDIIRESFSKRTDWHDIYIGTNKVGFAMTTFEKAGDEIITKYRSEIKVQKDGEERILIEEMKSLSDLSYAVKSFEYSSKLKDEAGIRAAGEVDGDEMITFLESPQKRKTHKTSIEGRDFFLPTTFIPAIHRKDLAPDMLFNVPILNYASLSIDNVRVVLEEIRPVKVGVVVRSIYKFRVGDSVIWSNEDGIIIKKEDPSGLTFYYQVETFAKEPADRILFDYTSLPYFKSNMIIPDTRGLTRLRLKIEGFELDPEIYKKGNIVLDRDTLIINKVSSEELKEARYKLPYDKINMIDYLNPDKWVLSDYKPLRDTALIYARRYENDPVSFAKYLNGYMDGLVKVWAKFCLSDSAAILESLSGDYLERTVMFASYARAGGLPTRLVGGLIYFNGYFYFHTWPEVWLDKWVPADPAFAQFPADVTHIPLKQGTLEEIISIIDDLRDIEIEIMEAI